MLTYAGVVDHYLNPNDYTKKTDGTASSVTSTAFGGNAMSPEDVADLEVPEMQAIAKAHGVHPALIALKWAHQRGEISIPFSVHNYASNLKCVTEDPLTEEEMATIATLEKGNRLVKGQVFLWHGAKDWHDLWDEDGVIVK